MCCAVVAAAVWAPPALAGVVVQHQFGAPCTALLCRARLASGSLKLLLLIS